MKALRNVFFLSIICFLSTIALLGCSTFKANRDAKSPETGMIEPQAMMKFSDIPVPIGLKQLPLESYSFESAGVRVGVLKYQGKANADQIVNFYKDQMSMYNWNLVNVIEYGQRLMNFERDNESCIITMIPKGSNLLLTISLGPKSQVLSRKTRQPVK